MTQFLEKIKMKPRIIYLENCLPQKLSWVREHYGWSTHLVAQSFYKTGKAVQCTLKNI